MIPIMIIILQFFHQYLFFSLAAQLSNWEAPAWRASALSSSSESFWSLSKTLSTFTRMISTTSSTWACVCCSLRLLVVLGGPAGAPPGAPSAPGAPGAPGAPPGAAGASGADIFYAAVWTDSRRSCEEEREGLKYSTRGRKKTARSQKKTGEFLGTDPNQSPNFQWVKWLKCGVRSDQRRRVFAQWIF